MMSVGLMQQLEQSDAAGAMRKQPMQTFRLGRQAHLACEGVSLIAAAPMQTL